MCSKYVSQKRNEAIDKFSPPYGGGATFYYTKLWADRNRHEPFKCRPAAGGRDATEEVLTFFNLRSNLRVSKKSKQLTQVLGGYRDLATLLGES